MGDERLLEAGIVGTGGLITAYNAEKIGSAILDYFHILENHAHIIDEKVAFPVIGTATGVIMLYLILGGPEEQDANELMEVKDGPESEYIP